MNTREERVSLELVMKNLNKHIVEVKKRTLNGLIKGVIIVRRDMEHVSPKIPVDTGNLRSSFFVVTSKGNAPSGLLDNFKGKHANQMAAQHESVKTSVLADIVTEASMGPIVAFGFSANYARKVHEMYGFHFQRPGAGAGFFVSAIYRNKSRILSVIRESILI